MGKSGEHGEFIEKCKSNTAKGPEIRSVNRTPPPPRGRATSANLLSDRCGLSLVEILFAVSILTVGLVSVMGMVVQTYELNVLNRNRVKAVSAARSVLDGMRGAKAAGLSVPEELMERFPAGPQPVKDPVLPAQEVEIRYRNFRSDLLLIGVDVAWSDMRGRPASIRLWTILGAY